jgi:quercetin dioxygenase-like cupin family protein
MQRSIRFGAVMLAIAASHASVAEAQAPARPETVLREAVGGMPRGELQDIHVMTAVIQPGQSTVFHTHRFPVTVYMLEGSFTLEMEGRAPVTITAGQSMVEPPDVRMTGYNRSASEPIRLVIFYVSDPGGPFLDPIH